MPQRKHVLCTAQCNASLFCEWWVCPGMLRQKRNSYLHSTFESMTQHRVIFFPETIFIIFTVDGLASMNVGASNNNQHANHAPRSSIDNPKWCKVALFSHCVASFCYILVHVRHVRILRVFYQFCTRFRFECVVMREVRAHSRHAHSDDTHTHIQRLRWLT